jgi:hypothetical protein
VSPVANVRGRGLPSYSDELSMWQLNQGTGDGGDGSSDHDRLDRISHRNLTHDLNCPIFRILERGAASQNPRMKA